jgi:hypothetical protein
LHTICIYAWRKIQFNYCPILARGHNWLTFQIQEGKGSRGYPAVSVSFRFVRFRFVLFDFVSVFFNTFRFVSLRSVRFRFDLFDFVSCQFVEETLSAQYLNNPFWDYCDISYKVNGCGKGSCVVNFHSLLWERCSLYPLVFEMLVNYVPLQVMDSS